MDVTLAGITTPVNPLQPEKAELPMEVTLSGMVMVASLLQPEKAFSGIESVQPNWML